MSFLTVSKENIFFEIKGIRMGVIDAPNNDPEQALVCPD